MPLPDSLMDRYEIIRSRCRAFRENEELFNDTSGFALMIDQYIRPAVGDPVADVLSANRHAGGCHRGIYAHAHGLCAAELRRLGPASSGTD